MFRNISLDDEHVIPKVLAGQGDLFEVLVRRYLPMVQAIAFARMGNASDVDDVAQEAFLKAYRSLPGLQQHGKFAPWLAAIARNAATSLARHIRRPDAEVIQGAPVRAEYEQPDHARQEILLAVRAQVDALDDTAREVILLYYFAGHDAPEIATMLEISDAAVRKRLQRAREMLGGRLLEQFRCGELTPDRYDRQVTRILGVALAAGGAWQAGAMSTGTQEALIASPPLVGAPGGFALGWGKAFAITVFFATGAALLWGSLDQRSDSNLKKVQASNPVSPTTSQPESTEATYHGIAADLSALAKLHMTGGNGDFAGPFSITGGVLRPVGKKDVSDATVSLYGFDDSLPWPEREPILLQKQAPHADGFFRFAGLAPRPYVVRTTDPQDLWGISITILGGSKLVGTAGTVLLPVASMGGTVIDPHGKPVADARIRPTDYSGQLGTTDLDPHMGLLITETTDANGKFAFAHIYEGVYNFEIFAPELGSTYFEGIETGTTSRVFELLPGASVEGRVVDEASGSPVEGVTLSLGKFSPFVHREAVSAAEGRFHIERVPAGVDVIRVLDEELLLAEAGTPLSLEPGESRSGIDVSVRLGLVMAGQVVDAATGEGISGASIVLQGENEAAQPISRGTQSDSTGSFRIRGLFRGSVTVEATHVPGYPNSATQSLYVSHVQLHADEPVKTISIPVQQQGLAISGRLLGDSNTPISGIRISIVGDLGADDRFTVSGEGGKFSLAGLEPNQAYTLFADGRDYRTPPDFQVQLGESSVAGVDLPMLRGALIAGQVVDTSGKALTNATVLVARRAQSAPEMLLQSNVTSSDGFYRIRAVPPGDYDVYINHRTGQPVAHVEVIEGVDKMLGGLLIAKEVGDLALRGRVTDAGGAPVAMAEIYVGPTGGYPATRTGEDGTFVVTGVRREAYRVRVEHPRYSPCEIEIMGGGVGTAILQGRGAVAGRVLDDASGKPLAEFSLSELPSEFPIDPAGWQGQRVAFRAADGAFELGDLPVGNARIAVYAAGHAPVAVEVRGIAANAVTRGIDIRMPQGAAVHGHVTNQAGEAVAGVQIGRNNSSESVFGAAHAISLADGAYRIENLPVGPVELVATHPDYALSSVTIEIAAGRNEFNIVLQEGAEIEGLVSADGVPIPHATVVVEVRPADQEVATRRSVLADAKGVYRIAGLAAGTVEVQAYTPAGQEMAVAVTLNEAMIHTVDFAIETGTAQLRGSFDGLPPGALLMSVDLDLQTPNGVMRYQAPPAPDSTFEFNNLPPGHAIVWGTYFDGKDTRTLRAELDIRADTPAEVILAP